MPRAHVRRIESPLVVIAVLSVFAWPDPVRAGSSLEAGWMSSTERSDAGNAVTLGARFGPMRPSTTGAELLLGTYGGFKGNTEAGWLGLVLDLDLAHTASLAEGAAWSSRIGTTLLTAAGEGGGGLAAGFNAGVGLASVPSRGVGFRSDLGYRLLFSRGSQGLVSVSVGLVWPEKAAGARHE
jgi:hypothetical protein